uniref:Uncharacterized protein n=1 Tax=Rhizophora mucronata TaxID=61149 RepID=A0A2P2P856_RHIMU
MDSLTCEGADTCSFGFFYSFIFLC